MRTGVGGNITVIVENHGCEPVVIFAGEIIGHVTPAAECREDNNGCVMSFSDNNFEETWLKQLIKLNNGNLGELQAQQLATLIDEFTDAFALNWSYLGLIQEQPARRIPFALRGTVDKMFSVMLKQGVI